jgi:hypothetical protein
VILSDGAGVLGAGGEADAVAIVESSNCAVHDVPIEGFESVPNWLPVPWPEANSTCGIQFNLTRSCPSLSCEKRMRHRERKFFGIRVAAGGDKPFGGGEDVGIWRNLEELEGIELVFV